MKVKVIKVKVIKVKVIKVIKDFGIIQMFLKATKKIPIKG